MTNPAYEATNSDVEKLIKCARINAECGEHASPEEMLKLVAALEHERKQKNSWKNLAKKSISERSVDIEALLSARHRIAELESQPLCVKSNDAMREVAPLCVKLPAAATDVLAERQRQITSEGWAPEHDDEHDSGEMAGAAACYARYTNARGWIFKSNPDGYRSENEPHDWPWSPDWWKPTNPRRDLVKAGALIIAEIERIDRAAMLKSVISEP
ncbi:hypothetical protein [Buttiauxella noackiae]|uniref:hypothetical protein n=1 Tax=Buttiauxella noackiae TaxID=82992 RepID=UPI0028D03926|nr:hypothetical protein [Buttiauxella noackiae]